MNAGYLGVSFYKGCLPIIFFITARHPTGAMRVAAIISQQR